MYAERLLGAAQLHVSLDTPLPNELAVGRGTALFVAGTCFCPDATLRSLDLIVDGRPQPVLEFGMPRLDFFLALHPRIDPSRTAGVSRDPDSPDDPLLLSYRSGFWGIARLGPSRPGMTHTVQLRATLDGGRTESAELARIAGVGPDESRSRDPRAARGPDSPRVAICMATHNPPLELLRTQLESIRAQTHANWRCVISDDCSHADAFAALLDEVEGDARFTVDRSAHHLGFFKNFERALSLVPPEAEFVALADQDDRWYPEKVETLLAAIDGAQLVYSDARIIAPDGEVIADTYWSHRRNNHSDLLSLLVANSVTGAASLFRRELLDYAVPFPPAQFAHYHDHWIALSALALGDIAFVDRPLYDYVQHGRAQLGHAAATTMAGLRERLVGLRQPRESVRMWRLHYFVDVCRLMQIATILELRCAERMTVSKRKALRRFTSADVSLTSLLSLGARGLRELLGHRETLGAEWMLFHAFAWRRLLAASARERPQKRFRLDAAPPPSLAMKPTRGVRRGAADEVAHKIAPLELQVSEGAPARINVLIPTVDLRHFFAGYIAKLNLARGLAERGLRVRVLTVDPVGPLPPRWRQEVESYSGLDRLFDIVDVEFGRRHSPVEVSPADRFVATTWWTAHIAARASQDLGGARFVYLIQEYEPFTFPMGSYAALASQSYRFSHFALFSSELLRDYFRRHRLGVYEQGIDAGDRDSLAFENALTAVEAPTLEQLAARRTRRLLFYARPEAHAARNLFELGVLALSQALEDGVFRSGWELHGIGAVQGKREVSLGGGAALVVQPRRDQRSYARLLHEHDVGLALMYTPHPSLVPLEMAAAGMLAVTNSFENKTAQAMAAISRNLIAGEPSIEAVAGALAEAAAAVDDHHRRVTGSEVRWSRSWSESFDDALLARVAGELGYGDG